MEDQKLQEYIATHVRCANGHHRPKADNEKPCPVCGKPVPFKVEGTPDATAA